MFMLNEAMKKKAGKGKAGNAVADIPAPGPDASVMERASYRVKMFLRRNYYNEKAWTINSKLAMNGVGFVGAVFLMHAYGDQLVV